MMLKPNNVEVSPLIPPRRQLIDWTFSLEPTPEETPSASSVIGEVVVDDKPKSCEGSDATSSTSLNGLEEQESSSTPEEPKSPKLELSRQLSEGSQFILSKYADKGEYEMRRVQNVLSFIAQAHRSGVLSLRDKVELKDLVLSKGSAAVASRLCKYPGGSGVLTKSTSHAVASKTIRASRFHVFQQLGCYSVTMFTDEALRLETAIRNRDRTCVVTSNFVMIDPKKIAQGLHEGTKTVLEEPNAGGKSFNSEALSFETLQALFGATNLITEMQVRYQYSHTSIVDFICTFLGHRIGVSVTRAMHFKGPQFFTVEHAEKLVLKKLPGLDRASKAVCDIHSFDRQILHIWAQSEGVAEIVKETFLRLVPLMEDHKNPTICLITVAEKLERFVFNNDPEFVYVERDPLGFEKMKQQVRTQEALIIPNIFKKEFEKKSQVDLAIRKINSASSVNTEYRNSLQRKPSSSGSDPFPPLPKKSDIEFPALSKKFHVRNPPSTKSKG